MHILSFNPMLYTLVKWEHKVHNVLFENNMSYKTYWQFTIRDCSCTGHWINIKLFTDSLSFRSMKYTVVNGSNRGIIFCVGGGHKIIFIDLFEVAPSYCMILYIDGTWQRKHIIIYCVVFSTITKQQIYVINQYNYII